MKLLLAIVFVFCLAGTASACDGVQAFSFGYGYQQPFVVQQFASPYTLGFAQPVYSIHQPFAFRQNFNHGFRQQVVFGGHRQVIVQRNSLFGNRQRIVVRH